MDRSPIREAAVRMQWEWLEMPQLRLTRRQAQRLWAVSPDVCDAALAALTRQGFLVPQADGTYTRRGVARPSTESIELLLKAM
jgi:hypothetical protein